MLTSNSNCLFQSNTGRQERSHNERNTSRLLVYRSFEFFNSCISFGTKLNQRGTRSNEGLVVTVALPFKEDYFVLHAGRVGQLFYVVLVLTGHTSCNH